MLETYNLKFVLGELMLDMNGLESHLKSATIGFWWWWRLLWRRWWLGSCGTASCLADFTSWAASCSIGAASCTRNADFPASLLAAWTSHACSWVEATAASSNRDIIASGAGAHFAGTIRAVISGLTFGDKVVSHFGAAMLLGDALGATLLLIRFASYLGEGAARERLVRVAMADGGKGNNEKNNQFHCRLWADSCSSGINIR